jgi:hypothetical protein
MAPVSHFFIFIFSLKHSIVNISALKYPQCFMSFCMAEDIDDEMKKLLKKFLKEGTSYFLAEKKARRMMDKLFTDEFPSFGHAPSPFSRGFGIFGKDDMKRWKRDNR